jgi:hypothetical protein
MRITGANVFGGTRLGAQGGRTQHLALVPPSDESNGW